MRWRWPLLLAGLFAVTFAAVLYLTLEPRDAVTATETHARHEVSTTDLASRETGFAPTSTPDAKPAEEPAPTSGMRTITPIPPPAGTVMFDERATGPGPGQDTTPRPDEDRG